MKNPDDPEIETVDRLDNAVAVTFKDETSAIYPAKLLHAAKGVADAMWERQMGEESQEKTT